MESRLGSDGLANKLCNHLLTPRECVQAAGLNIAFADALAGLLFPNGHTFLINETFGAGTLAAEAKKDEDGNAHFGYHALKIISPHLNTKTATMQVGGVVNMANSFYFSEQMEKLIAKHLYTEGKIDASTV
eukprot:1245691-Pleurochrysis_carterae.AAC.1